LLRKKKSERIPIQLQLHLLDPLLERSFVDEQGKNYGITYFEFLRHQNNEYMDCEVINGFMFLLREQFNNGGKNCFFPTQFFPAVLDEKISRSKQGEQSKLTNFVNSNKDEWMNNWESYIFQLMSMATTGSSF
jgi:hypothetical protein